MHPLSRPTLAFERELIAYEGPFLPAPIAALVKQIVAIVCDPVIAQQTICRAFSELIFGPGGKQQNLVS